MATCFFSVVLILEIVELRRASKKSGKADKNEATESLESVLKTATRYRTREQKESERRFQLSTVALAL